MNEDMMAQMAEDSPDERETPSAETVFEAIAELEQLYTDIANSEDGLRELVAKKRTLEEGVIPDMMLSNNIGSVGLADGRKVVIQNKFSARLPAQADAREDAFDYIIELGGEPIIKSELTAKFGKSKANLAASEAERLREEGFNVEMKKSVHPQTLTKWAREMAEAGTPMDDEIIPTFTKRVAVIQGKKS